jgi:hypothetical protein
MRDLAQTNVQLCRQVIDLGWNDDDLLRLRRAYELAMFLFSGQFRANGKTQVAHHVGVASALADCGARPLVVTAGLLHSAYPLGEFGDGRPGVDARKRARVDAVVGTEVETLVDAYAALAWTRASVRALIDDADASTSVTRDLVAMRVANEVDEVADATARFAAEKPETGLAGGDGQALVDELARAYGLDCLGARLREAAEQAATTVVPDVLVSTNERTVFVAPASHRRRLHVVVQDSRLGHGLAARVPGARRLAARHRRVVSRASPPPRRRPAYAPGTATARSAARGRGWRGRPTNARSSR